MTVGNQIPDWATPYLSAADREAVERAIAEVERHCEGEIVTVVVRRSVKVTQTHVAFFAWAIFLVSTIFALVVGTAMGRSSVISVTEWVGQILFAFLLSLVILRFTRFWLRLLPQSEVEADVFERAELEFYRARVHQTAAKVGILLFLSLDEHRAVVLADERIAKRLPPETWTSIVRKISSATAQRQLGRGLVEAVRDCGQILRQHFPAEIDNPNELANRILFREQ